MLRSGKKAAVFTLFSTALGIACIPIDMLLTARERRLIAASPPNPEYPLVFVCGPARSGTTLVFQVLAKHLNVSYLQNLTALFPRSPIVATRIYRKFFGGRKKAAGLENYYGKTSGMYGPSEANHIWNRWVAADATGFRTILSNTSANEASQFFAAFADVDKRPTIVKNNNMNVFADIISRNIPNSLFICLRRDPAFLAQSLLQARRDIRGDVTQGYGVQDVSNETKHVDPIESVCEQVKYLNGRAEQLQLEIGADRFWIVDYEEFCRDPSNLVLRVAAEIGDNSLGSGLQSHIKPIEVHNVVKDHVEMNRIVSCLGNAGSEDTIVST